MNNKIIMSLVGLAISIPGAALLLDNIQPQSENIIITNSINNTLDNASYIMKLNNLTLEVAIDRSIEENRKGISNGMYVKDGYLYYTVGLSCMKGTIVNEENIITKCEDK
jgi:hypothetical protein